VVFRWPRDTRINYIKRLVGLPGDRVEVKDDHLVINGETINLEPAGKFNDGCYVDVRLSVEKLGEHTHKVMSCLSQDGLHYANGYNFRGDRDGLPKCGRAKLANKEGNYVCEENPPGISGDSGDTPEPIVVPAGHYLMIGDNRDNSADSRTGWFVPDSYLVGKATRIWFNFDLERSGLEVFNWSRIGDAIE